VCPKCGHHYRINPAERIRTLVDPGSFQEFSQEIQSVNPIGFPGYEGKLSEAKAATGQGEP